jgi:hypothetical protein
MLDQPAYFLLLISAILVETRVEVAVRTTREEVEADKRIGRAGS